MVVNPDSFPFMVLGNKIDLEGSRAVTTEQAQKKVNNLGSDIDFLETSAKDSSNVEQAFV